MNTYEINILLSQLLQAHLPAEAITERLAQFSPAEWSALLGLAHQHKVLPMLYQQLAELPPALDVPQNVQEGVRRAYLKTMMLNRKLLRDLRLVLEAFKGRGLDVIVLKGAYLLEHAYAHIGLRSMHDVDLLVRQADLPVAIACIEGLGYRKDKYFDPEEDNRDIMHIPPMVNANGLQVEVHWSLLTGNDPIQIDLDGIWRRAVPTYLAGVDALAMSAEDLLLHLCTHATYQHTFLFGLRPLVDIQQMLRTHQDRIDWDRLVQTAQIWRVERVIGLTFHLLGQVLSCPVPQGVLADLLPEPIDPTVIDRALDVLFNKPQPSSTIKSIAVARLASITGFQSKTRLIWETLFPPKVVIARRFNLSQQSWHVVAYYPLNFIQTIARHAGAIFGLMKRDQAALANQRDAENILEHKDKQTALKHWMVKH